ncbi:MAG: hypothetical protein ACYTGP_06205 [Planctomycetota bacterium]|jgi:hypothetical protein
MSLPGASEINPFDYLDGRIAALHFLGKSLEQAEALFRENSIYYQEDLLFMGPIAFRYYVPAAVNYIRSDAARGDSDMVSCLASILEHRLRYESVELAPVASSLTAACHYVVEHYGRFDLDAEIYGDVRSRYHALEQAFRSLDGRETT